MVAMSDADNHDTRDQMHLCFPAVMSHNWLHTPDYQVLNEMNETVIFIIIVVVIIIILLLL